MMEYKKGAEVRNANGEKVGEIDRVVIDPNGGQVSHIVVRKGFLFPEDKVIPLDLVRDASSEQVNLSESIDFDNLPDFTEVDYLPLDTEEAQTRGLAAPMYWYPTIGAPPLMWGAGHWGMYPPGGAGYTQPVSIEQNIPEGEIALEQGAEVIDQHGESLGKVEQVITSRSGDQLTHIVVTKGMLDRKKKLIPASWISHIKEDGVKLCIDAKLVDKLKDYDER
jgi:uncharacterized protein YrrD